jgi:hypothetical protein
MRTFLVIAVALFATAVASADIVGIDIANDGDGAINSVATPVFAGDSGTVTVMGDQFWAHGHMVGTITSDTALDPTLIMHNLIDNDTGVAWTSYQVNVKMSTVFTLSNDVAYDPSDWTSSITQPTLVGSEYIGSVLFTAGTPVGVGDTFEFGYRVSFDGATSYQFCQEMVPVPEPATMGLLALGGLAVLRRRR